MEVEEAIIVRRPERWSEPLDASMSDADVAWLRSREPFASMDAKSFPRTIPLEGILRNDCRLRRCEPGEVIVREGDYGNSAFLVIAGSAAVAVHSLQPEQLGRQPPKRLSWWEALQQYLNRSKVAEARRPDEVTPDAATNANSIRQIDDRPALFLQDFDAILHHHETVSLGPGELFGEVAAMYRSPRTATVVAETEVTLLEVRWQGLKILRRDRNFADTLDEHYRTHWLPVHLREIPLLRYVPESALNRIAEATELRSFGKMEWNAGYKRLQSQPIDKQIEMEPLVAQEGRLPTELIVVRSGFARLSEAYGASHRTTAYLGKGHLFGLEELACNALSPATDPSRMLRYSLRAVGFLDALFIPAEVFAESILPHVRRSELPAAAADLMINSQPIKQADSAKASLPKLDEPQERRGGDRRAVPRATTGPQLSSSDQIVPTGEQFQRTDLLEFIVQHRLNNGREAMVIDLHRCTRCDDCVRACAAVHDGNPRFVRQGFQHQQLQFVQACMQCSDPVCMIGCPTGAIARDEETGVVEVHESICVGCGLCAASCPYENIRMMDVFDHEGRAYKDAKTGKSIAKATKCDSCSRQPSGPACASACPHDALVRIDLTESSPLQQWLEGRGE